MIRNNLSRTEQSEQKKIKTSLPESNGINLNDFKFDIKLDYYNLKKPMEIYDIMNKKQIFLH